MTSSSAPLSGLDLPTTMAPPSSPLPPPTLISRTTIPPGFQSPPARSLAPPLMSHPSMASPTGYAMVPSSAPVHVLNPFTVHVNEHVPVKLDDTNYMLWRYLFFQLLELCDLDSHVASGALPPSSTLLVADGVVANPAAVTWVRMDKLIRSWISSTVIPSLLPLLYRCQTASAAWDTLHRHFQAHSMARSLELRTKLIGTKKDTKTIAEYCQELRTIFDSLDAIGEPMTDRQQIEQLLYGLPSSYDALVTVISHMHPTPSFKDVWSMLLQQEARLDLESPAIASPQPTALVASQPTRSSPPPPRGGFSGRHHNGRKGKGSNRGNWNNHGGNWNNNNHGGNPNRWQSNNSTRNQRGLIAPSPCNLKVQ